MPSSSSTAPVYRAAWAVNNGASTSCPDTPTLLPTSAIAATPDITTRPFGRRSLVMPSTVTR